MESSPFQGDRQFANADSFAQAFDEAWANHDQHHPGHGLSAAEKLEQMLELLRDHPFHDAEPALARQVAEFRVRLLGL
ncbi:MAG: hypothetical protein VKN13_01100 [Cyanobacteriota bacterium]|nr:hypothetical protein [Cyanobacteriota bacterium]